MHIHGAMLTFQNSYYLAGEGALEIDIYKSLTEAIVAVKDQPGFRFYWQQRKPLFFSEFQKYVDSALEVERKVSKRVCKSIDTRQDVS